MGMLKKQDKYTPSLPGMQSFFLGRKRLSSKEKMERKISEIRKKQLPEFRQLFSSYIPVGLFSSCSNPAGRNRIFNLEITFWAFLNQVLTPGTSCSDIVKKVQTWMLRSKKTIPSSNTSAYCQARKRLPFDLLEDIFKYTADVLENKFALNSLWHGRHVKVIDGSGLSMPDTPENQKLYPQNGAMKPGCGFPQISFAGLFSLSNGALLNWKTGNRFVNENVLFRQMWSTLKKGDLILGDRAYCTYTNIASLIELGVDSVFRLHHARKINWRQGIRLGKKDKIFIWKRPVFSKTLSNEERKKLPEEIKVRVLELPVIRKGFRTKKITIATTLLNAEKYTADELAKLYFQRWAIELFLRDIKTSMGMDILTSLTPEQIQKEITMHTISYNVLRGFMQDAAEMYNIPIDRISFKGTAQQLNQWIWVFLNEEYSMSDFRRIMKEFYEKIVDRTVSKRPGRSEPRAKKRRPKNYNLLNKPRGEMVVSCHRNNTNRKNAFYALT
jgi:hypothetical protein